MHVIWLPTILILGAYASFQLYYNDTVTGDAFQFPYTYYHKKFDVANMFVFEKPNYANYSIEWLRWYNRAEAAIADPDKLKHLHWPTSYTLLWTLGNGIWTSGVGRYGYLFIDRSLAYLAAVIFHFPLIYMLYISTKDKNARQRYLPLLGGAVFAWTAFALGAWSLPHYYAPYFVAIYLSLFIVMHDIKFHPAITTSLTLFAIILLITTGGRMI